jgi:hypothetical protein
MVDDRKFDYPPAMTDEDRDREVWRPHVPGGPTGATAAAPVATDIMPSGLTEEEALQGRCRTRPRSRRLRLRRSACGCSTSTTGVQFVGCSTSTSTAGGSCVQPFGSSTSTATASGTGVCSPGCQLVVVDTGVRRA